MTTTNIPSDSLGSSSEVVATGYAESLHSVEQQFLDRVTGVLDLPRGWRALPKSSEVYSMVRKIAREGLKIAAGIGRTAMPIIGKLLSTLKSCCTSLLDFSENAWILAYLVINFRFGSSPSVAAPVHTDSDSNDSEQSQNIDYDSENDSMPDLVDSGEEDTIEQPMAGHKLINKSTGQLMLKFDTNLQTKESVNVVSIEVVEVDGVKDEWRFEGLLANSAVTLYKAHMLLKTPHVSVKYNQINWFANSQEGMTLFRVCTAIQHDQMPVDCIDVDQWLKEEFFILTGLRYELKDDLFFGKPVSTEPINQVGYCWTLLFANVNLDSFRFHPVTSGFMLKRLVDMGKEVFSGFITATRIRNGRMWHVSLGGTMTAMQFITEILQDDELVGADAQDFEAFEDVVLPAIEMDAEDDGVIEGASAVVQMLHIAAVFIDNIKQAASAYWDWASAGWTWFVLVKLLLVFALICHGVFRLSEQAVLMAWQLIKSQFGRSGALRLAIWTMLNVVNTIQLLIRYGVKTTFSDTVGVAAIFLIILSIAFPWVTMLMLQVTASLGAMLIGASLYTGFAGTVQRWVITFASLCLDSIIRIIGPHPLRFLIRSIITMWIIRDRDLRGTVLVVTHDANGVEVVVTDTYEPPADHISCGIILKDLILARTSNFTFALAMVTLLMLLSVRMVWVILRPIIRTGALFTRMIGFGVTSGLLIFLAPSVSLDALEYASLMIYLHGKNLFNNLQYVLADLVEALSFHVANIKAWRPEFTPDQLLGFDTHVKLPELQLALFRTRVLSVARSNVVRFVTAVENINIPGLLKQEYTEPSLETVQESIKMMQQLGWPVNVEVSSKHTTSHSSFADFEDWILGESNFVQPLHNIRTVINEELRFFKGMDYPVYKHTGTYTSPRLEVEATARYFKNNSSPAAVDVVNDTWEMVHLHFEKSRLANTAHVVSKLVKKYSAGFGFMDPTRPKTMSRKVLMKLIGGEMALVELFDRTLPYIGKLVPIAHVFTKFETIKESKWAKGIVRTIIGVPLVHYANTSKFSYMQNARHPFDKSPIKVGMPLTGAWFADLWEEHATRAHHFNGDLKSADSSYSRRIFDIIKAVRKKGFNTHRDFDKICSFIDIAYDQLMVMPLAFKSTGVVAYKGDGGATGQGNTSIDNSVALVVLYMMAWKNITGKSAKEFKLYNTLSNQGDDHILSYDDNDLGWSPASWMPEFAKLGVTVTDESGSDRLEDVDFLAKRIVTDDQNERIKLGKLGIKAPRFLTAHDKGRLLGKINAEQPLRDNQARARRLLSYLYLTAHHEDVYLITVRAIRTLQSKSRGSLTVKIPPYRAIMKAWYSKKDNMIAKSMAAAVGEDDDNNLLVALDEFGDVRDVVHVTKPKGLDTLLICLSMVPQMFSPRFMTSPALRHIQKLEGHRLAWVGELLARRNDSATTVGGLSATLVKSNYDFLNGVDMAPYRCHRSDLSLLVSHWVFIGLQFLFGGQGVSGVNKLLKNFDHWIANLYFVLFAQTTNTIEAVGFGYIDTMLCIIADLVPDFACGIEVPRLIQLIPSELITRFLTKMWRYLQPSAALDFEVIELLTKKMDFVGSKTIVVAPTGVGKSTRMISKLASLCPTRHIYVIEPRHILVTGLADYMSSIDHSVSYGASTTGRTASRQDMVVYCTYQSFVLNNFGTDDDIVVIDEAHIKDPIYKFAVKDMLTRRCTTLLVTATPDPNWQLVFKDIKSVELNVAKIWRTVVHNVKCKSKNAYVDAVVTASRSFSSSDKVLIFMPTINNCKHMAKELPGTTCIISSKHKFIDENAQFYVSTRVSDAGLTLPDVNFVFTMDIDFNVSSDISDGEWYSPRSIREYYRLDDLTINQRVGRTGRTCDGTVFLFNVEGNYTPRQSTAKDLLDELDQLLDLDFIVDKLPEESLNLWHSYVAASEMLGGDITPQSLFPSASHQKNPSAQMKQNVEWCVTKGMAADNAVITCFDPLRTSSMFPDRITKAVRRGDPIPVPEEGIGKRKTLVHWGLMPINSLNNPDWQPDTSKDVYKAQWGPSFYHTVRENVRKGKSSELPSWNSKQRKALVFRGDMPINSLNNPVWQPDANRDVYNLPIGGTMYPSVAAYYNVWWSKSSWQTRKVTSEDLHKRNSYICKIVRYKRYLASNEDLLNAETSNAEITLKDKIDRLDAFFTLRGFSPYYKSQGL